jgi:hypothetical protein
MQNELSVAELESEIATALPERALMHHHRRRRRHHNGGGTSANNGSVANSNRTSQVIFNPQVAIGGGRGGIVQIGGNSNTNSNTQFGVPINFVG